ncbi:hypothetical protein [Streptomyces virginiae]|uniref:hypothetical protein n=1 Tax=Streptomyces virginiae TaxID=1961 RepID=UPI0022516B85|nr:hypothetical protein [Streptomyces virginiae]MCX4958099.1 hypothetical protein [Streptomyces virginiae]
MNRPATAAGTGRRKPWQRRLAIGAGIFVSLCILGVLAMLLTLTYEWGQPADAEGRACCWEENATPEWTAGVLGLRVPETATDRRAGLHSNVQYDVALLTFTVSTAEADRFLQPLLREGAQMARNRHPEEPGYTRSDGFSHLGLPEPETFTEGMRITSVCPREAKSPESEALRLCAEIHAHEFQPGTTRVYIWAGSDAPLQKPPT